MRSNNNTRNVAIVLIVVTLWFLHGLDIQFYTIQDNRLFDINLYLAVIFIITAVILLLI